MTSAISMISCGEDVIASQGLKVANIDSIHHEQLLSEVFSEWEKDLVDKVVIDAPFSEVLDIKIPFMRTGENQIQESKLLPDIPFQKSVSSGSLTSMEWVHGTMMKPSFLEIPGMDLGSVYGMRRAFSEGDIKVRLNFCKVFNLFLFPVCASIIYSTCLGSGFPKAFALFRLVFLQFFKSP